MTVSATLYSSATGEWSTPQAFFDELNAEFAFDCDMAANGENAKCERWIGTAADSLALDWASHGSSLWCNPPYGRNVGDWFVKAREAQSKGATVVMLVPARTDTKWFHAHVWNVASEIRFVRGRLRFGGGDNAAPFPSMVVVYRP